MDDDLPVEWFKEIAAYHLLPQVKKFPIPLLFIHGAWGGKYQFAAWMRICAEQGWESYAIDLRGHHQSIYKEFGSVSIFDYADDVEDIVKEIGPVYLVGHSMGALISQLVVSRSEGVKKAVFVASTPPAGIVAINSFILKMLTYAPQILFKPTVSIKREDALTYLLHALSPDVYDALVPESSKAERDIGFWRVWISDISCPTLVLAAGEDRAVPRGVQRAIARKYGSTYKEVPGMSHMLMLQKGGEAALQEILNWLGGTRK